MKTYTLYGWSERNSNTWYAAMKLRAIRKEVRS